MALGTILGIGSSAINAGISAAQSNNAAERNYQYNEKSANNADQRTRKLYKDLYSPSATIEQLQEAGLSPSLYASNGAGTTGTSGAQGGGTGGTGAPIYTPMDLAGAEAAQAQARKLNAEADVIEGKNERGRTEIENLILEGGGIKAETAYKKILSIGEDLKNQINEGSIEDQIRNIQLQGTLWEKQIEVYTAQIDLSKQEFNWNKETWNDRKKQILEQNTLLAKQAYLAEAQANLAQSNIKLNEKQIEKFNAEIDRLAQETAIEWAQLEINKKSQEAQQEWYKSQDEKWRKELQQSMVQFNSEWRNKVNMFNTDWTNKERQVNAEIKYDAKKTEYVQEHEDDRNKRDNNAKFIGLGMKGFAASMLYIEDTKY